LEQQSRKLQLGSNGATYTPITVPVAATALAVSKGPQRTLQIATRLKCILHSLHGTLRPLICKRTEHQHSKIDCNMCFVELHCGRLKWKE
jgi:hypothetical protein